VLCPFGAIRPLHRFMVERYGVVPHAYVLMGNHYHLLVEWPSPDPADTGKSTLVRPDFPFIPEG